MRCPSTPATWRGRGRVGRRPPAQPRGDRRRGGRTGAPPDRLRRGSTRRRARRPSLVYCHYDVQPVDPIELWETAPWEPFLRDGRFVGRGVADDKGQLVMHLAALEALRAAGRTPGGEPHLRVRGRGGVRLREPVRAGSTRTATASPADVAIISDTGYFEGNLPAITVGLRGIMYAQIDVELSPVDLHSGMYGGHGREPGQRARDDHRRAQGPRRPDPRSRASTTTSCRSTDGERAAMAGAAVRRGGVPRRRSRCTALVGEAGFTIARATRARARPSTSTACGAGSRARARRRSSRPTPTRRSRARLVADQDPAKVFERPARLRRRDRPARRDRHDDVPPRRRPEPHPTDHPATRAAARALERRVRRRAASTSAKAARSRSPRRSTSRSACRSCCSGSPSRRATPTPPTSGSISTTSSGGTRVIVRLWDELARRRGARAAGRRGVGARRWRGGVGPRRRTCPRPGHRVTGAHESRC